MENAKLCAAYHAARRARDEARAAFTRANPLGGAREDSSRVALVRAGLELDRLRRAVDAAWCAQEEARRAELRA